MGLALLLCACSGSGGSDETCALDASTHGALTWETERMPACLIPFGPPSGIWMVYNPLDEVVSTFEVDVRDVTADMTGTFPATVTLNLENGELWQTATPCSIEITENEYRSEDQFSTEYQVVGTGHCTDAAMKPGSSDAIVVDDFAFRFPAHW